MQPQITQPNAIVTCTAVPKIFRKAFVPDQLALAAFFAATQDTVQKHVAAQPFQMEPHYGSRTLTAKSQMNQGNPTAFLSMVQGAAPPEDPPAVLGTTDAPSVVITTRRNPAEPINLQGIITPFRAVQWEAHLRSLNIFDSFRDVVQGIKYGFDPGISNPPYVTFTPPNHSSAHKQPSVIDEYITTELRERRYTGPFSRHFLERYIGPFRTSPLGLVPKAGSPNTFRMIQDFSFPRGDPLRPSINDYINVDDFPCEWGSFSEVLLLVIDAPPNTQAATLDVDSAFRRIPLHPSSKPSFVIHWQNQFYVDHTTPFGSSSSPGLFGRAADAMVAIYKAHGVNNVKKWVDDFLFFRYPLESSSSPSPSYSYDIDFLISIADNLGWPWKPSKTHPFNSSFTYLGFLWNLSERSVEVPPAKREKFLRKLEPWRRGDKPSAKETESLLGTLVHCSLAMPDGRSRLVTLSSFSTKFLRTRSSFSRLRIPPPVTADVEWWHTQLSTSNCRTSLKKPPPISPTFFAVDASTSWGIGVVIDDIWESWQLLPGWNTDGRQIGWAEMVAIEMGLHLAVNLGHTNIHLHVRSDNAGVIGALKGGKSRNLQQNRVLQRIVLLMRSHDIWITVTYIPSADNRADPPSRGVPCPTGHRIPPLASSKIPFPLAEFLVRSSFD
jgi:Reverse transcriptase (RNA-dependent DNA polymerase)/Reverse transcriptase-like